MKLLELVPSGAWLVSAPTQYSGECSDNNLVQFVHLLS